MRVLARLPLLLLAWMSGALALPSRARACSCHPGGPGRFYLGDDGHLPAGTPGIPYHGPFPLSGDPDHPANTRVKVLRIDGREYVPVDFSIVRQGELEFIVPITGFAPGDAYLARVRSYNYEGEKQAQEMGYGGQPEIFARVLVRPESLPLHGATLELSETRRERVSVPDGHGACNGHVGAAVRDLTVVLPPELEPYRDHLLYTTLVDRKRWSHAPSMCSFIDPGRTWSAEPGTDRLFTGCPADEHGLDPGAHEVAVQLSSPDGTRTFVTPPLRFELACETAPAPAPKPAPAGSCDCDAAATTPGWLALVLLPRRRRR